MFFSNNTHIKNASVSCFAHLSKLRLHHFFYKSTCRLLWKIPSSRNQYFNWVIRGDKINLKYLQCLDPFQEWSDSENSFFFQGPACSFCLAVFIKINEMLVAINIKFWLRLTYLASDFLVIVVKNVFFKWNTYFLRIERRLKWHTNGITKVRNAYNNQRQPLAFCETRHSSSLTQHTFWRFFFILFFKLLLHNEIGKFHKNQIIYVKEDSVVHTASFSHTTEVRISFHKTENRDNVSTTDLAVYYPLIGAVFETPNKRGVQSVKG